MRRWRNFRELHPIESWGPLPMMDVVFRRNVQIYFDVGTRRAVMGSVQKVLQPWGYRVPGAETTINLMAVLERTQFDRAGCYRRKGR